MTFEERLAALGVETRDFVPSDEHCKSLYDKFYAEAKRICKLMGGKLDGPFMVSLLLVAVADRDTIINRMETRLDNVIGERNYLLKYYGYDCKECVKYPDCSTLADSDDFTCVGSLLDDWAGVPEDWRADDD